MTHSSSSKKKAESSSSSSSSSESTEKAPSTDVEAATSQTAGVSDALKGPTTADLNPAYNAAAQEEAQKDQQDK